MTAVRAERLAIQADAHAISQAADGGCGRGGRRTPSRIYRPPTAMKGRDGAPVRRTAAPHSPARLARLARLDLAPERLSPRPKNRLRVHTQPSHHVGQCEEQVAGRPIVPAGGIESLEAGDDLLAPLCVGGQHHPDRLPLALQLGRQRQGGQGGGDALGHARRVPSPSS